MFFLKNGPGVNSSIMKTFLGGGVRSQIKYIEINIKHINHFSASYAGERPW